MEGVLEGISGVFPHSSREVFGGFLNSSHCFKTNSCGHSFFISKLFSRENYKNLGKKDTVMSHPFKGPCRGEFFLLPTAARNALGHNS